MASFSHSHCRMFLYTVKSLPDGKLWQGSFRIYAQAIDALIRTPWMPKIQKKKKKIRKLIQYLETHQTPFLRGTHIYFVIQVKWSRNVTLKKQ